MVFKGKDEKGTRYLNPRKIGKFSVHLKDKSFNWRLPLASLLQPKIDPETKEAFPGDYNYNPYTGNKLINKE